MTVKPKGFDCTLTPAQLRVKVYNGVAPLPLSVETDKTLLTLVDSGIQGPSPEASDREGCAHNFTPCHRQESSWEPRSQGPTGMEATLLPSHQAGIL